MCKHCGGTGESFGRFCTCTTGKAERAKHRAKIESLGKPKKQLQVEVEIGPIEQMAQAMSDPPFKPGDWVLVVDMGVKGWAMATDGKKVRIDAYTDKNGNRLNGKGWFSYDRVIALDNDFDGELDHYFDGLEWKAAIDRALDEKDKEKFLELTTPKEMPW